MNKIKFSHNWNNKFFTTIRKWDKEKEIYYRKNRGEEFEVILQNKFTCYVKLIGIEVYDYNKIPYGLLTIDTGTVEYDNIFLKFGIKKSDKVLILTFEKENE